jgi:nitrogen fixation NifU-like protein
MGRASNLFGDVTAPKTIREHFCTPQNVGTLEEPTGSGEAGNEACGDVLRIDVEVSGGKVARIAFQARACSAVIGTASLVTETVRGRPVEEALTLDVTGLVDRAGGVPPSKRHAPRLVERALRAALGG